MQTTIITGQITGDNTIRSSGNTIACWKNSYGDEQKQPLNLTALMGQMIALHGILLMSDLYNAGPSFSYMANRLGAWQVGDKADKGKAEFRIFFPEGRDPQIHSIQVAGDFQDQLPGMNNWDFEAGPHLTKDNKPEGTFWHYQTDAELDKGFYQYKYRISFINGESRIVSDPCTRYSGSDSNNAGFVIGGSQPTENVVHQLASGRRHLNELIIYELHISDFVLDYNTQGKAPLEAVIDKLEYIKEMGFNAILFMPWTGVGDTEYNWGYEPALFFSVSYQYANKLYAPAEKISWLKMLISECHKRDIHVIMDGVYNHVSTTNFPYKNMYLNRDDCPYTGDYLGTFPGLEDLDFNNECTNEFIFDVCRYWIDVFKIDGIRFDNTTNFYQAGDMKGLDKLIMEIKNYADINNEKNFSLTIEHIDKSAGSVVNNTDANSYWDNALFEFTFHSLWHEKIDSRLLNALNNRRFLRNSDDVPTLYLSNHDHSFVTFQTGAKSNTGSMRWYKTQPYSIALFTSPATPLVQAGTEFGEDYFIPENDEGSGRRVIPRPIRWKLYNDNIGQQLSRLYRRLAHIRSTYEGLQSPNFYPQAWEEWQNQLNPSGYGVDTSRQLAIYHRWGHTKDGVLQRFIIVLNFSDTGHDICVPFPENGQWTDLLTDSGAWKPFVENHTLCFTIGSNWGHIFFR
jgi:pullulanase